MFLDDVKQLRNIVKAALLECLNGQIKCEKEFGRERHFFMKKLEEDAESRRKLETQIKNLQESLSKERSQNMKIFVDETVDQLCQKAYYSFELQKSAAKQEDLKSSVSLQ